MLVLVLGGTGFIGSYVVDALVAAGHETRVFGRSAAVEGQSVAGVDYRIGDLSDRPAVARALTGVDAVIHLISATTPGSAELDPVADIQTNLVATLGLLAEMERQSVSKLIYLSSGGTVYADPVMLPIPESHPLGPKSAYGIVKLAVEGFLARQASRGLQPVVIRAANAYGPRAGKAGMQGFVTTVLHRLVTGQGLEIWGDGTVIRDYLHVRDLAQLCILALRATAPVTVNAGSGQGRSLTEVITAIERVTGRKVEVTFRPTRTYDRQVSVLDASLARTTFGWTATTPFDQGLAETWDWVQTRSPTTNRFSRERRS